MRFNLNDLATSTPSIHSDVCIVGSGPAGLSAARKLASLGFKIFLAEGGGHGREGNLKSCYEGEYIGDPNYSMAWQRRRYFGGSSNCWGGWCRPLDSIDFNREDIDDHCIWPITSQHLIPYSADAAKILDVDNQFDSRDIPGSKFKQIQFQFSQFEKQTNPRPTRLREKYGLEIDNSKNITFCVDANLTDGSFYKGQTVKYLTFTSSIGKRINVAAKYFVFAMGGIENPRYLLWFRKKFKAEFSRLNLPIGRYWMDHPHYKIGEVVYFNKLETQVSSIETKWYGPDGHAYLSFNSNALLSLRSLNGGFRLKSRKNHARITKRIIEEFACAAPALAAKIAGGENICVYECLFAYEQFPDKENRVELDLANVDLLGIPRVQIFNKKREQDSLTLKHTTLALSDWLTQSDIGRMKLESWLAAAMVGENQTVSYPVPFYAGHHMGGTRMSNTPSTGVVDKDCRVHGSSNLFITGSSCFPTGGHSNPTFTIVQLALRLADHLANCLKSN